MKNLPKSILIAVLILGVVSIVAQPASASVRFRGGFFVGPAIRPWGWYAPYYYGPYGPYGFYGPYGYPNAGEVKLHTNVKDAGVFINGAYAGTAGKLKSMWLRPDTYDLEIRAADGVKYTERIYVVAGKTVNVHADLHAQPKS
jgi:PEGA domain